MNTKFASYRFSCVFTCKKTRNKRVGSRKENYNKTRKLYFL